ncbi:uncharacterized protein LOC143586169 [Bidens hawaiensis]|uniref:uncharacterized protein LOC143586169 n=1 Tax=Bidens hawaiensis TaxID=980011 RepID=UPI004049F7A0
MSILGANYPRCNSCDAKKLVQTSDDDTYKGIHTCLRLSATSDFTRESESALSILKNSDSSTTTESKVTKNSSSSTTVTDNSSGVNCAKIMSGSVSMERWKRQMEDIRFPNLKLQLASSNEPKWEIVSEVAEDSSWNLSSSPLKTPQNEKECPSDLKESEKELDDKISKLHQLVAPFGKNEAPAVLLETLGHIRFLHGQIEALMTLHIKQGTLFEPQQQVDLSISRI